MCVSPEYSFPVMFFQLVDHQEKNTSVETAVDVTTDSKSSTGSSNTTTGSSSNNTTVSRPMQTSATHLATSEDIDIEDPEEVIVHSIS